MNTEKQHEIMNIATPYIRMVLGEFKSEVVDTLYNFIQENRIILDDWKWVVSDNGHLCVTIDCKIRARFSNSIFFIDVIIVMLPSYPNDNPHIYLRKRPYYVVNLKCPYIRNKCVVNYNQIRRKYTLKEAILECERLFSSCCPVFISTSAPNAVEQTDSNVISALDMKDIEIEQFIGSGAFGNVHRGKYKGKPVAIKELKSIDDRYLKNIRDEITTQFNINNQFIIKIYGCCFNANGALLIVMELADCSLTSFLRKERKNLSDFQKGKICYDISLGLYELYRRGIIHRDIKLDNILCVGKTVKISDFGFARLVGDDTGVSYSGTPSTMAPEFFTGEPASLKADVYSFGCIMEEIFSGVPLHSDQHFRGKRDLQHAFLTQNYRPTIHSNVPPEIQEIIRLCFRDQDSRVSIDIVARMLYNYLKSIIDKTQKAHCFCLLTKSRRKQLFRKRFMKN